MSEPVPRPRWMAALQIVALVGCAFAAMMSGAGWARWVAIVAVLSVACMHVALVESYRNMWISALKREESLWEYLKDCGLVKQDTEAK